MTEIQLVFIDVCQALNLRWSVKRDTMKRFSHSFDWVGMSQGSCSAKFLIQQLFKINTSVKLIYLQVLSSLTKLYKVKKRESIKTR